MAIAEAGRVPGIPILYEDDSLLIVDKPAGMLSQPGRVEPDSVVTRVLEACREIMGPSLVHRLDMDTSGLLILAKNKAVHKAMQQQFEKRQISKRYCAVLERIPDALGGRIHLPLRLDINNRPRQIVCQDHGKASTTVWHRLDHHSGCAVWFYPMTGRTHQLRVHASEGLGNPIRGDRLYGKAGQRMLLHADKLDFIHPVSGERCSVESPAPFSEPD